MPARVLLFTLLLASPLVARADDLIVLLQQQNCPDCRLADADLVHADLRDSDLRRTQLQRANLGQAHLDGADLRGSNLTFANLRGASLKGADLRGSTLYGADLRQADLTSAQLDTGALEQAHWEGARGFNVDIRSHAALHNAGVNAAENNEWEKAEALFSAAIAAAPKEPLSWIARGLCRGELGQRELAAKDLAYAGTLFHELDDQVKAEQLELASQKALERQKQAQQEGTRLRANQQRVAANALSVPNNTPSPCCSPASTQA